MAEGSDTEGTTSDDPDQGHLRDFSELEVDEGGKARKRLLRGLITMLLLGAIVIGLLAAVPGLRGIIRLAGTMPVGMVLLALGLEILSCVSYAICFLQVFDRAPLRFGARVAMSELAFGAAVPLGGAGSVAVGAWLIVERGVPVKPVAQRSAVLFLLTSAINVITLAVVGIGTWFGLFPGKHDPLLTLLPGLVAAGAFFGFLLIPPLTDRWIASHHCDDGQLPDDAPRIVRWSSATSDTIRATARVLFSRDWRIIGAWGYLWFDIFALVVCLWALGEHPELSTIVLAYQIGYMSNLIPIPGGIGVLDGSIVALLVLFGVGATVATSATIVYHAISLWVPAIWGTITFLLLQRDKDKPLNLRPPRPQRQAIRAARRAARKQAHA